MWRPFLVRRLIWISPQQLKGISALFVANLNNAGHKTWLARNRTDHASLPKNAHGHSGGGAMMSNDDESGAAIRLAIHPASRWNTDRSLETHARSSRPDRIGRDLRAHVCELLREPLPDCLLDLIARLGLTARRTLQ